MLKQSDTLLIIIFSLKLEMEIGNIRFCERPEVWLDPCHMKKSTAPSPVNTWLLMGNRRLDRKSKKVPLSFSPRLSVSLSRRTPIIIVMKTDLSPQIKSSRKKRWIPWRYTISLLKNDKPKENGIKSCNLKTPIDWLMVKETMVRNQNNLTII